METIKVLFIEDEKISREQLARVIRKEGFEVLVTENNRMGLDCPSPFLNNYHPPNILCPRFVH